MPEEIADAFAEFELSLRPSAGDRTDLLALRARAESALLAGGRVRRVVDTGSFAHGTAVRSHSRFDLLAVLTGSKPSSRTAAVEAVRSALPPDLVAAGVGRVGVFADDSVVVEEVGAPGIRILPAFEAGAGRSGMAATTVSALDPAAPGGDELWVLDAVHRWVRHRPAARPVLLSRVDDDGALRRLIRLVLAWKHRQDVPVSSYYLETAAIRQGLQQRSFSPLWDLCWLLERLSVDALAALPDLTSPSQTQPVRATGSLARSIEAQFPVERAASSARGAVNAYLDGDQDRAHAFLVALFGTDFPVFGQGV